MSGESTFQYSWQLTADLESLIQIPQKSVLFTDFESGLCVHWSAKGFQNSHCFAVDVILLIPSYFKSSIADVDYYSVLICLFANNTAAIIAVAPDQKIVM